MTAKEGSTRLPLLWNHEISLTWLQYLTCDSVYSSQMPPLHLITAANQGLDPSELRLPLRSLSRLIFDQILSLALFCLIAVSRAVERPRFTAPSDLLGAPAQVATRRSLSNMLFGSLADSRIMP